MMKVSFRFVFGCGFAWRHAVVALPALLMLASANPANADGSGAAFDWSGAYAGVFAGSGRTGNRIIDIDGFANWGNAGSVVDYDDEGFVGGALIGKKFDIDGTPLRIELDGTFGNLSAKSNMLDPEGLDETVETGIRWIATARVGVEEAVGPATVFATGGLAAARIANSVTDIDCCPEPHIDPDDSFRDSSTEFGWVIGVGVQVPLADDWTLRLEGSYLDFGRSTYYVNRSGGNACGPGGPPRPCPYNVENRLSIVRLAIIYRFGR